MRETILIDKNLVIYFTRNNCGRPKRMMNLYYHEIMGNNEGHGGKKT